MRKHYPNLTEFARMLNFTVTPLQEQLLEAVNNTQGFSMFNHSYRAGKRIINNEFTCDKLMKMYEGDKFALVSPAGVRVFTCTKIQENQ
jgi:hypothetical protein